MTGIGLRNVGLIGNVGAVPPLYTFSTFTLNAGTTGSTGPTIAQIRSAAGSPSWGTTYLNSSTTGVADWTVPTNGRYRFVVAGAAGGYAVVAQRSSGAVLQADVDLQRGSIVRLAVGQEGLPFESGTIYANGHGGGGGSFVFTGTIGGAGLILAAGGGGGQDDTATAGSSADSSLNPGYDATPGATSGALNTGGDGIGGYEDGQGWLVGITNNQFVGSTKAAGANAGGFGGGGGSQDDGAGGGGFTGGSSTTAAGGGAGGSYYAGLVVPNGYTSIWESALSNYTWVGQNAAPGFISVTLL